MQAYVTTRIRIMEVAMKIYVLVSCLIEQIKNMQIWQFLQVNGLKYNQII